MRGTPQSLETLSSSIGVASILDAQITATSLTLNRNAGTSSSGTSLGLSVSLLGLTIGYACVQVALLSGFINGALSNNFIGEVSEFVEIITPLTTVERDKLRGYLAWNSGLQTSAGGVLPVGHPYYYYPPILYITTTGKNTQLSSPNIKDAKFLEKFALNATTTAVQSPTSSTSSLQQRVTLSTTGTQTASLKIQSTVLKQTVALTPKSVTTQSPSFTYGKMVLNICLQANPVSLKSPLVRGSLCIQTDTFSFNNLYVKSPVFSGSNITVIENLTAQSITTAVPQSTHPVLSELYPILANSNRFSSPVLIGSLIYELYNLSGQITVTQALKINPAQCTQQDNFQPNSLKTGSLIITSTVLVQTVNLKAQSVTQGQSIVVGQPKISGAACVEIIGLIPNSYTSKSPILSTASLIQNCPLSAINLKTSSPILSTVKLVTNTNFTGASTSPASPIILGSNITENYSLQSTALLIQSLIFSTATLIQNNVFKTQYTSTSSPIIRGAGLTQQSMFASNTTWIGDPTITSGNFDQTYNLFGNFINTISNPVLSTGQLIVIETLTADALTTAAPIVSESVSNYTFISQNLQTQSPNLSTVIFTQIVNINPQILSLQSLRIEDSNQFAQVVSLIGIPVLPRNLIVSQPQLYDVYNIGSSNATTTRSIQVSSTPAKQIAPLTVQKPAVFSSPTIKGNTVIQNLNLIGSNTRIGSPTLLNIAILKTANIVPFGSTYQLGHPAISRSLLKRRRGFKPLKVVYSIGGFFPYYVNP